MVSGVTRRETLIWNRTVAQGKTFKTLRLEKNAKILLH